MYGKKVPYKKKMAEEEKTKKQLSSFSILFIIIIVLAIVTQFASGATFSPQEVNGEMVDTVVGANLSDVVMAPFNGFRDALDISVFVLILGGFLNIVTNTGALDAGIQSIVKKFKGNEIMIIVILMSLFSLGGTAYGMAEETIPFYTLLTGTMVAAGFDTMVTVGTVLLGAGTGVLGSTINPFSTGAAMDALRGIGVEPNVPVIMSVGAVLWITTTIFGIYIVTSYAKKVHKDKGSTILSIQEQKEMEEHFSADDGKDLTLTGEHKVVLTLFGITFLVMIISLIPWGEFGIGIFEGWTAFLTGESWGDWYFADLSMWFFIMSIVIALIDKVPEKEIVDGFVDGAADMLSVVLVIVVARGVSVLMSITYLDLYILDTASGALSGLSPILFVIGSFALYSFLSFLIPSTSGLAYVSIPIMGGLANEIGMSPDVMIMIFASGVGLVNLVTPTSGVVMGGLEVSRVEYSTWVKFITKPLIIMTLITLVILIAAMLIVS